MWSSGEIQNIVAALTDEGKPPAARAGILEVISKHGGSDAVGEIVDYLLAANRPDAAKSLCEQANSFMPSGQSLAARIARADEVIAARAPKPLPRYPSAVEYDGLMTPLIALDRLDWIVALYDVADAKLIRRSGQTEAKLAQQEAAIRRGLPPVTMVTLPKSGTMYSMERITKQFDIPHFSLGLGTFPKDMNVPSWVRNLARGGAISVEHTDPSAHNLQTYRDAGIDRILVHVRDPRQSLLSWIHHVELLLDGQWDLLNQHMPALARAYPRFSWEEKLTWHVRHTFVDRVKWIEEWLAAAAAESAINIQFTTYEDFHRDTDAFYQSLYRFFALDISPAAEQVTISRTASTHFRKGETDEWRRVFSLVLQNDMSARMSDALLQRFNWTR